MPFTVLQISRMIREMYQSDWEKTVLSGYTPIQRDCCPGRDRPTNHNRLSTMRLDKYDECECQTEAFPTESAATEGERPVDSAMETGLNKLERITLTKRRRNDCTLSFGSDCIPWLALFFGLSVQCVTCSIALIGCWPIELCPDSFWSAPFGDAPWKVNNLKKGSSLIAVCNSSGDTRLVL